MRNEYKICKRCIMDTTDPDIVFDENGICNHCRSLENTITKIPASSPDWKTRLRDVVAQIKKTGENNKYDCVIGLSGGVDSSYVAYQVKKLGLRPLAVHLDNGWNSELAIKNIEKLVETLNIDLYTYVINWEEFRDIQLSFLKASVVDFELPTDHAILGILYKITNDRKIKYIISGGNVATEGIMPRAWNFSKVDAWNIKGIHKIFGKEDIESLPLLNPSKIIFYRFISRINNVRILNYMPYTRNRAVAILKREFDWCNYGGKHFESIITKFYQVYILPKKFNIDKRKAHYSALICSGQISRDEALALLKREIYPREELDRDMEYFLKKLGLSKEEFTDIMKSPIKKHTDYPSLYKWMNSIGPLKNMMSKLLFPE
ncbi:MAG: N-acetyl sugar amidotransferase [Candidatus Ranarchaeia archaeon]